MAEPSRTGHPGLLLADERCRVLAVAQEAARMGLMTMTSGNFSARNRETGLVAITPSGRPLEAALETAAYAEEGARVFLLARPLGEPTTHPRPSRGMMYAPTWWR